MDVDVVGAKSIVDYHTELDGNVAVAPSFRLSDAFFFSYWGRLFDDEGICLHGNPSLGQPDDWYPYKDCVQFETADLFYRQIQLSASQINVIMKLWSAAVDGDPSSAPFENHKDLYNTIDWTPHGDIPWSSFTLQYNGEKPVADVP